MHLVIAIILLGNVEGARILSGDTDSIKVSMPDGGTRKGQRSRIMNALRPLHEAVRESIDTCSQRLRRTYPQLASPLESVGEFMFENDGEPYAADWEAWSKCRALLDQTGRIHVVAAGVPRKGGIGYEAALNRLYTGDFARLMACCMSFDLTLGEGICRNVSRRTPRPTDTVDMYVTDYLGSTEYVSAHQAVDLTNVTTTMGSSLSSLNRETISWLTHHRSGYEYAFRPRYMDMEGGKITVRDVEGGLIMEER